MKTWIANNKGLTIIFAIVLLVLLAVVIAGPTLWAGILASHGL
ncbi:MAG: hypothetical protein AAF485_26380 [Chloroflexota bacterium]